MTPLVSIILPTYNGSAYIEKSIESCLTQTYTHFELIIVNDCSTDNTEDIIEKYRQQDNRITCIKNEINKKLPQSLNIGFEKAKGEYFTWTSDDNYFAPNAIEEMVKALEKNAGYQLVYCNYTIIDDTGKISGVKKFGDVNESMVKWQGCGACFLYHSGIHHELKGFDPSAFLIEDYDFFIRALTITRFFYLDRDDLYYYRLHSGSLTSLYGYYNFDLQKIVVERQLPKLFAVGTAEDKTLWLRKYTIYYGVSKNNITRMNYYLTELFRNSKRQCLVTVFYILYKKTITGLQISFHSFLTFFKLLVGIKK